MKISLLFLSFILGSIFNASAYYSYSNIPATTNGSYLQYYVTNHDANKYYNQMPQGTVDYSNLYYKQPVRIDSYSNNKPIKYSKCSKPLPYSDTNIVNTVYVKGNCVCPDGRVVESTGWSYETDQCNWGQQTQINSLPPATVLPSCYNVYNFINCSWDIKPTGFYTEYYNWNINDYPKK